MRRILMPACCLAFLLAACDTQEPAPTAPASSALERQDESPHEGEGTRASVAPQQAPLVALYVSASSSAIVDLVGDQDNFGYGGTANPPCVFYDLSELTDDLGIFDRELTSGDEVESWTHDFTSDPNYCLDLEATSVFVEIPEKFSDFTASTIEIDGQVIDFTPNGFTTCGPFIVQTFNFSGAAASFANDGIINMTFRENGDDIALDFSRVTIEGICLIEVDIDIKPGSFPNSINPKSMGVVPVAILGSDEFDVLDVDVTTLAFGPDGAFPAHDLTNPATYWDHVQDVNFDGYMDLVSHYRQKETGLAAGGTEACISGATLGGTPIEGCDSVRILGH